MITRQEALDLFRSDDLIGIGMEADSVRRKWHPEGIVSYIIDRNINYTNFCTEYCSFCAFYRPMGHAEGYVLPKETIYEKIQETLDLGGTGVLMQGGLHPDLKIEWYEDLFRGIKQRFPIHLHCLSAPEVANIAEVSGLSLRETIRRLMAAGLDSIPGGGAEILDDAVRHRISRLKCSTQEWIDVHRTAHQLGMRTTATMMFGCGETLEQRMNHLELVRNLQEETGGFTAFIPWTFQRANTALGQFREGRSHGGGIPPNAGHFAHLSGQHRERAIVLGDAGAEDLPVGAALRRQRRGQHHDRGKRGGGGRGAPLHHAKRNCGASSATPGSFPSSGIRCTGPIS